jgi:hypothetical protein
MAELNISLKDYLKNVLNWKAASFSKEGATTLSIRWRSFEATLSPWEGGKTSFIYRRFKRLRLNKLLSKIKKVKLCPVMLKELQDPSSLTPEDKSRMSDKDLAKIELLAKIMQETGQKYQTALEYFTEQFAGGDAMLNHLSNGGPYSKEDILEFPFDEWLNLISYNTSVKCLPSPYICLEDSQFRKWYFDIQVLMRTESVFIESNVIEEEITLSLLSGPDRWALNRNMKPNLHEQSSSLVQDDSNNEKHGLLKQDRAVIKSKIKRLEETIKLKEPLGYDVDEFIAELLELRSKLK